MAPYQKSKLCSTANLRVSGDIPQVLWGFWCSDVQGLLKDTQVHCAGSVDTQADPWSLESKFMGEEGCARAVTLGTAPLTPPPADSKIKRQ